ncbi:hypothetical protein AUP68_04459 [Ilyonectria robusta]
MAEPPPKAPLELIRFKDAVGRKFSFPFDLVKTWQGMEDLIKQAFLQVDVLGPHVMDGHYDIISPDGEIILPQIWERLVQPGWSISMVMWPIDNPPPPDNRPRNFRTAGQTNMPYGAPLPQQSFRPGGQPQPTYGAPQPPQGSRSHGQTHRRPGFPMPPGPPIRPGPPVPQWDSGSHNGPINIIEVGPPKRSKNRKKKQPDSGLMSFLAGGPPKKKKHKVQPPPSSPSAGPSTVSSRAPSTVGRAPRPPPKFGGGPFQSKRRPPAPSEDDRRSRSSHSDTISERSNLQKKARVDAREQGLIIVSRSETRGHRVIRHPTFPILEKNPLPIDRQAFSAARLYQDEASEGTVCLELTKSGSGITSNFASNDTEQMRWLTVTRNVMDLNEFENIALNREDLAVNPDVRLAMESIFKTLHDKKLGKSRNTWYIKTGTVIRCDVDADGKTNASALFVSVPQLQADSFNRTSNVQLRSGICLPRRLHEMSHPYDTSLIRDKNQLFRSHEGAQSDEVLWIGDTWVLIIDSVGILTYGSKRRQTYLSDNIEIRDPRSSQVEERTIHVTHPDGQQFQIPFEACQTFYKLQSAIRDQLLILEDDDSILDFELVIAGGEAINAKSWSRLVQKPEQSMIKLLVEWVQPDGSESDRDSIKSIVLDDEISHLSGEIETDKKDAASKSSILGGNRSRSASRQRTTVSFADNDFFGIKKQASTTKDEDSDLDIPELNSKVPPFLGWSILEIGKDDDNDDKTNDEESTVRESIRVCLSRAETALKESQHPFIAKLKDNFSTLDLPSTSDNVSFSTIDKRILQLAKKDSKNGSGRKLRFSEDKIASLYKGFLSASIRTLEAYTFKEFTSPVISSYYTALSNGLESPKLPPENYYPVRWVLSREPIPIAGFKYLNTTLDGIKCPDCNSQKIYDNIESAIDHLRKRHCAGSTPGTRLVEYLIPLSEAKDSRLGEECSEVLRTCRDTMVHITRRLRDIQDAMVFDGQFQKPAQGIPFSLLKSLELIVAFVCAVPMLLDEMYWFYNYEIDEQKLGNLVLDGKIRAKYQLLKDVGRAAETLTKDAERALVSSINSKRKEDVVKFFTSVGSHCVATQIICNLLKHPIQNNASAAELYQAYCTDYVSTCK